MADPALALILTAGSGRRINWRCQQCGHQWATRLSTRTSSGAGCPRCAIGGYDASKPGTFYVVTDGDIVKCGITNLPHERLGKHARQGLTTILNVSTFDDGTIAPAIEWRWKEHVSCTPAHAVIRDRLPDGYTEALHLHDGLLEQISMIIGGAVSAKTPPPADAGTS
jgi:hypothetical protein